MSNDVETVTLTRAEYEALVERAEEAEDLAAVAAAEAREAALGTAGGARRLSPLDLVRRLDAGDHPIGVWRALRGLSRDRLAAAAGIAPSHLGAIETRRRPGSFAALAKLAKALGVSLDALAAWVEPQRE